MNEREIQPSFFSEIVAIFENTRKTAYYEVNKQMMIAYWATGQRIVQEEQKGLNKAEYGSFLIRTLSKRLTEELGKGFSISNLKNFRQFYLIWPEGKGNTFFGRLSWSHCRLLMRIDNVAARNWYAQESVAHSWSSRHLERNINTLYYERLLSTKVKAPILFEKPVEKLKTTDFIKDPYLFEFLTLTHPHSFNEADLEKNILNHLQQFLLELGKGFSFVSRQYRLSTETSDFYLDLVFYNYLLKCFVLIDLKTTRLTHQDVGQMDMYVRMFDDLRRCPGDQPTIGIILCADKDETVAKYSVLNGNEQLFASKYRVYLPTEKELINEIENQRTLLHSTEQ
jgi:predicted nuclease of restriction endonuclease-like (RecB) superfamily